MVCNSEKVRTLSPIAPFCQGASADENFHSNPSITPNSNSCFLSKSLMTFFSSVLAATNWLPLSEYNLEGYPLIDTNLLSTIKNLSVL